MSVFTTLPSFLPSLALYPLLTAAVCPVWTFQGRKKGLDEFIQKVLTVPAAVDTDLVVNFFFDTPRHVSLCFVLRLPPPPAPSLYICVRPSASTLSDCPDFHLPPTRAADRTGNSSGSWSENDADR